MTGRIQKDSLITAGGLAVYIGSIVLKEKYTIPLQAEFLCFFAAYLLSGYSIFKNIANNISKKIFLKGTY